MGISWLVLGLGFVLEAKAVPLPVCLDNNNQPLAINNYGAAVMKHSPAQYPNGTNVRLRVSGVLTRVYPDQTCHTHLEIQLQGYQDTIEVIYSQEFGPTPVPQIGEYIEACGDYIIADNSPYGAIIHWIHATDSPQTHQGGYLVMDRSLCGQTIGYQPTGPSCKAGAH